MADKGKQRESLLDSNPSQQSQVVDNLSDANPDNSQQINGDSSQMVDEEKRKKKRKKDKSSKVDGEAQDASQVDNTAIEDGDIAASQAVAANHAPDSSAPQASDKKSKKRKRKSEAAAAVVEAVEPQAEEDNQASAQVDAPGAQPAEDEQPNKKKKRKNKEKRNKAAPSDTQELPVNGDDTEMGHETQGIDDTMLTVNGNDEDQEDDEENANTTAAALEKQRKREKKQRKKEKKRKAMLLSQQQEQEAEQENVESDSGDIPVPQLDEEPAAAAPVEGVEMDEDEELEAPPAEQSVVIKERKKGKNDKKEKKAKGKQKEKEKALPLFQPEEPSDVEVDVEVENAEEEEEDEFAVPELPPPLSSSRKAPAEDVDMDEDSDDEEEEEENGNIDPSLLDPQPERRRSTRTTATVNGKDSTKIQPSDPTFPNGKKSNIREEQEDSNEDEDDDDEGEEKSSEENSSPVPVTRTRGRPSNVAAADTTTTAEATTSSSKAKTGKKAEPAKQTSKVPLPAAQSAVVEKKKKAATKAKDGVKSLPPSQNSAAHNELLTTKWMDTKALNDLKEEGLFYKTGTFSVDEDAVLRSTITEYQVDNSLSNEQLMNILFSKGGKSRKENGAFWQTLAEECVDRPLQSVFHRVRRMYSPDARQGPWTPEQDKALTGAVRQLGEKWEQVGAVVGRWSNDCRDRYRNHLGSVDKKKTTGQWTTVEENKLRKVISQVVKEKGMHFGSQGDVQGNEENDTEVFWTAVSARFGGSRTRAQCRIKWNDNMRNKIVDESGKKLRWGRRDTYILVQKLKAEKAERQSEINWSSFIDPGEWDWWSSHVMTKRFITMRARAVKALANPDAGYPEILRWLVAEQEGIPRSQVVAFMAAGPQRERAGGNDGSDGEDEDEEEEVASEPVPSAKKDKGKGRAIAETAIKKAAKPTPAKPTPTKAAKAKEATASAPAPPTSSRSTRSAKASSSAAPTASTSKKGQEKAFRTKEFIGSSDEEEEE